MSILTQFSFEQSVVRTHTDEAGKVWFVAADVCRVLGISNPRDAVSKLEEDEKLTVGNADGHAGKQGGAQCFNTVSESGLYALILRSRKPKAKVFRKWVTSEVIPSIRKTGRYELYQAEGAVMGVWLAEATAAFMRGVLSSRRLNAVTRAVANHAKWEDRHLKAQAAELKAATLRDEVLFLIDRALFGSAQTTSWEGTVRELESLLLARHLFREVRELSANTLSQVLDGLQRVAPGRVSQRIFNGYTVWRIVAPVKTGEVYHG